MNFLFWLNNIVSPLPFSVAITFFFLIAINISHGLEFDIHLIVTTLCATAFLSTQPTIETRAKWGFQSKTIYIGRYQKPSWASCGLRRNFITCNGIMLRYAMTLKGDLTVGQQLTAKAPTLPDRHHYQAQIIMHNLVTIYATRQLSTHIFYIFVCCCCWCMVWQQCRCRANRPCQDSRVR